MPPPAKQDPNDLQIGDIYWHRRLSRVQIIDFPNFPNKEVSKVKILNATSRQVVGPSLGFENPINETTVTHFELLTFKTFKEFYG